MTKRVRHVVQLHNVSVSISRQHSSLLLKTVVSHNCGTKKSWSETSHSFHDAPEVSVWQIGGTKEELVVVGATQETKNCLRYWIIKASKTSFIHVCLYLCKPWTPPSFWAEVVLFSNFRSPEYIMALSGGRKCYTSQTSRGRMAGETNTGQVPRVKQWAGSVSHLIISKCSPLHAWFRLRNILSVTIVSQVYSHNILTWPGQGTGCMTIQRFAIFNEIARKKMTGADY